MSDVPESAIDRGETPKSAGEQAESRSSGGGATKLRAAALTVLLLAIVVAAVLSVTGVLTGSNNGSDEHVTKLGSIEITARLTEIRGKFLPNDGLYNYVFVLKYEVLQTHRGEVDGSEILIGHYNPLKSRAKVADEFYPGVGGTLKKFRVDDTHRMALDAPLDDHYMGGIINRYFKEKKRGPIYWATWTNLVD